MLIFGKLYSRFLKIDLEGRFLQRLAHFLLQFYNF